MNVPNHLKHKPIFQVRQYDRLDGPYANKTDAKGLSIGIAQWNGAGESELSAKIWRYTGTKWSRQSEEVPLHRVLDLATLVCAAVRYAENGNELASSDGLPITFAQDNPELKRHLGLLDKELKSNKAYLDASLDRLADALRKLGKF